MKPENHYRCPVCRAAFRQTSICSRCGADLTRLMTLAAKAYSLRQQARQAISGGAFENGLALAHQAQDICATSQGATLCHLAAWCAFHFNHETPAVTPSATG